MTDKISSLDIAAYLIELSDHEGLPMTQISLQKLVTLCQSRYVHQTGTPIFADPVLAYKHGPVTYALRQQYMDYGKRLIDTPRTKPKKLPSGYFDAIAKVWALFAPLGNCLIDVTHEVGPWSKYRANDDRHAPIIPNDELGDAWQDYVYAAETRSSQEHDSTPANYCVPALPTNAYDDIIEHALHHAHRLVMA